MKCDANGAELCAIGKRQLRLTGQVTCTDAADTRLCVCIEMPTGMGDRDGRRQKQIEAADEEMNGGTEEVRIEWRIER